MEPYQNFTNVDTSQFYFDNVEWVALKTSYIIYLKKI